MKKSILFSKMIFSTIVLVLIFSVSLNVKAVEKETKKDFYCPLCTKSEDDPLYKKERQFYQKVKIIKDVFGDSIDEVALAATVLHRYGQNYTYNVEYTENFDENSYQSMWSNMLSSLIDIKDVLELSDDEKKLVEENEKIDLLTLAAIVMIDSNHRGIYSDVCYREGLAGDGLVGNTEDDSPFTVLGNGLFCGAVNIVQENPISYISSLFSGDSFLVTGISAKNRVVNTKKVCENGYVAGLYQDIYKLKDGKQKESMKKKRAKEIIDFSNYYKQLYGHDVSETDSCMASFSGVTGEFENWKQADSKWGSISLGGTSSIREAGCLVTSISMQIARSGTKIGTLPSGFSEFNPGSFVTSLNENNGFVSGGNYSWGGFSSIAPNWGVGEFVSLGISDNKKLAEKVNSELSSGYGEEGYQKFLVLQIHHSKSPQHWVAVNKVENGTVTIYDPAGKGTTLDDNYSRWVVDGYRVMYAKDVKFGQTGSTNNNSCFSAQGEGSLQGIMSFLRYVEGDGTCNYRGGGEGSGYTAEDIGDGAGMTTALGITERYDAEAAASIGYTDFISDLHSGCTSKEYIDKMLPSVIEPIVSYVEDKASDLSLTDNEKYAIASVGYGGFNLADNVIENIRKYGKTSNQVYNCFKSYGCGFYGGSQFSYGLSLRRMAEYEIFSTGNYNAAKPEYLGSYGAIQSLSLDKFKETWPTKRDTNLWDGTVGETHTGAYCKNGAGYETSSGGNLDYNCTSDTVHSQFSCETLRIVENHLYDFDATNFNSVIASYGGFENYARSLGGVFSEYYGKKIEGRTEKDFQRAAEYVIGWMYMYGMDYKNGNDYEGVHKKWGNLSHKGNYAPDAFYVHGGYAGKYNGGSYVANEGELNSVNFDWLISGKLGVNRMAYECGDGEVFIYNKLGISRKGMRLHLLTRLKDLKVGDVVGFWHSQNAGGHVAVVGETYDDRVVIYDVSYMISSLDYKRILYFPEDDSVNGDREVIKKEFKIFDTWGSRRYYNFTE